MTKPKRKSGSSPLTGSSKNDRFDPKAGVGNPEDSKSGAKNSQDPPAAPGPGGPPPPPLPSSNPFQKNEVSNETWYKLQSMPSSMRVFLEHNFEEKWQDVKCLEYYRILIHFNPETKSRPHHKKSLLYKAFKDDVAPILQPYKIPAPPAPMQTDNPIRKDFNPLSRRVKREQLVTAILDARPSTAIASDADIGSLLYLYRAHVDKDLQIPGDTEYVRSPNVVTREMVKDLLKEELRMSLQDRAPHVFIHARAMTHPNLVNLYIKFVLDEEVESGVLVRGFHYSLLRNKA